MDCLRVAYERACCSRKILGPPGSSIAKCTVTLLLQLGIVFAAVWVKFAKLA